MGSIKILVIDDDHSTRIGIRRLLVAAGFSTAEYGSAEELLAGDAGENAACIVCDLMLPGISGLALLAKLRVRGVESPFILITGDDCSRARDEAHRRGATFLAKSSLDTALLDGIRAAIEPPRR